MKQTIIKARKFLGDYGDVMLQGAFVFGCVCLTAVLTKRVCENELIHITITDDVPKGTEAIIKGRDLFVKK